MTHDPLCPAQRPHIPGVIAGQCTCHIITRARKDERASIVNELHTLYLDSLMAGPDWLGGIEVAMDKVKDEQR